MWVNALSGGGGLPKVPTASLLLHMDGTNGSTTITDEYGKTFTARGNAQITTAQSQWGGASLVLDGTDDLVDCPDFADATPGSSDWLFECWVRPDINNALKAIASKRASTTANGGWVFYVYATGNLGISAWNASAGIVVALGGTGTVLTTATWHHVGILKIGTVWGTLLDGFVQATYTETGTSGTAGAEVFRVGRDDANTARDFDGHIDECRIVKGTEVAAIYPNALTSLVYSVPVAPFEKG